MRLKPETEVGVGPDLGRAIWLVAAKGTFATLGDTGNGTSAGKRGVVERATPAVMIMSVMSASAPGADPQN